MFSLKNKTAVVTGGGSGIGKAIAIMFSKQGADVHIVELNLLAAQKVVDEISSAGGKAFAYSCNVSIQEEVVTEFNSIGKIDILVNNAGIAHVGNVENTSTEEFDKIFNVNAAVPLMKKSSGVILNLSSIAAAVGLADRFAYSMSKGAIHAMTLSVAKDYINQGIRCNSISPARVHTPFVDGFIEKNYPGKEAEMFEKLSKSQPIGRMGTPEEVAALALYLCSDEAGFLTGCDYLIDGGFVKLNN
jgi:2-keto-3-deoxy-L-fuconate dehydrogenase